MGFLPARFLQKAFHENKGELAMKRVRTIVVTGADRGLGYELARQYAERGEIVFAGAYRANWHLLEALQARFPETVHIVEMDVSSDESVRRAADKILRETERIDILINNAGVWLDHDNGTILDGNFDYERMMRQFNVNALGSLRVTEALIHAVLKGFDCVVANISSEAGSIYNCKKTSQFGYCMSKCAMNMWSAIVLNAIQPHGGAVLNFHPGWMQSVIGSSNAPDAPFAALPDVQDAKFYITPAQSAEGIIKVLDEPERFSFAHPGFVNYRGDQMLY